MPRLFIHNKDMRLSGQLSQRSHEPIFEWSSLWWKKLPRMEATGCCDAKDETTENRKKYKKHFLHFFDFYSFV